MLRTEVESLCRGNDVKEAGRNVEKQKRLSEIECDMGREERKERGRKMTRGERM